MPCLRHSSPVSSPASDSFRIPTICSSVYRLVCIRSPPRPTTAGPYYGRTLTPCGLIGGEQLSLTHRGNARGWLLILREPSFLGLPDLSPFGSPDNRPTTASSPNAGSGTSRDCRLPRLCCAFDGRVATQCTRLQIRFREG